MDIETIKQKTAPVFGKFGVQRAGLFGSFARGDATNKSDMDFVVSFRSNSDASDIRVLTGLKEKLEDTLGRRVDLSQYANLKRRFRPYIISEQIIIYDEKD